MIKKLFALILIGALALSLTACGGGKEIDNINDYVVGKSYVVERSRDHKLDDGKQYTVNEVKLTFNEDNSVDQVMYSASVIRTSKRSEFHEDTYTNKYGLYKIVKEKDGQYVIKLYLGTSESANYDTIDIIANEDGTYKLKDGVQHGELVEVPTDTELPTQDFERKLNDKYGVAPSKGNSYNGNSGSGNKGAGGYDMPLEGESFSDYVQRVDPELYESITDRYNTLTGQ